MVRCYVNFTKLHRAEKSSSYFSVTNKNSTNAKDQRENEQKGKRTLDTERYANRWLPSMKIAGKMIRESR